MREANLERKRSMGQPPGPGGRWLVGNSYDYDRDRIGFLRRCQAVYGDTFSFSKSTIVTCDPEVIHAVLNESSDAFFDLPLFASAADSAAPIAQIDGVTRSRHKVRRQVLIRTVTQAHGDRLVSMLDKTLRSTRGREFDVTPEMMGYCGHAIADFLFGSGAEDAVAEASTGLDVARSFMSSNLTYPKWLPLPKLRRSLRAEDRVVAALGARVQERRADPHSWPEDMLDLLLGDEQQGLSEPEIVGILNASLQASLGAPGPALAWVIREMARNSQVFNRLREEARQVLADTGSLTDDARLPFSKAFVKEVLRLYPPIWLIGRTARVDWRLGDVSLPAGKTVMFSPYLLQRDPRWWPEPDRLLPERWLKRAAPGSRRAYLPFGAGSRICLGMHLALYQLTTAASHLAACYQITTANAEEVEPFAHALLVPRGLRASITPLAEPEPVPATMATAETG